MHTIGMNLAINTYWSTEFPFIDRMKSAGPWGGGSATAADIKLDERGWPLAIPAQAPYGLYTIVPVDPASAGTTNRYVIRWKGKVSLNFDGGVVLDQAPNRVVVAVNNKRGAVGTELLIGINDLDPAHPYHAMTVVREDQVTLFDAGAIFNPVFTAKMGLFDTLRYMDWINTNVTSVSEWADRTRVEDRTWQTAGDTSMPIEIMVALANETRTHMWLNVPTNASDNYVRQMMTYVRDNLDKALGVHLEWSNEVWNWGFRQAGYAHLEAAKLWGTDANGDGVIDPNDKAEQYSAGWVTFAGYRAAQVAAIANDVFKSRGGLDNVLPTQTGWIGIEQYIIDGVARAGLGEVKDLFTNMAGTIYYGANLRGENEADRATILGWARAGEEGVLAAIAAIEDGTGLTGHGSIEQLAVNLNALGSISRKLGVGLVAYEGGPDMAAAAFPAEVQGEVLAFQKRIQAHPRYADTYRRVFDRFDAAGGTLACILIDVSADSAQSMYGQLKTIYDSGSVGWDVLVAMSEGKDDADPVPPPPVDVPEPAPPVITRPSKETMQRARAQIAAHIRRGRDQVVQNARETLAMTSALDRMIDDYRHRG